MWNQLVSEYRRDPRWAVALCLLTYLLLGFTLLGFNRNPFQVLATVAAAVALQMIFDWIFFRRIVLPLSACITGMGISLLLNYSHDFWPLLIPVFFAISTKFIITFKGKHTFNPAMIAVVLSLLLTRELITAAPAYQWNGPISMAVFIVLPALLFFMGRINRWPLIISFLTVFTLQCFLRGLLIKHYLPFETLFLGTITSPPFFLFTFFMITDPATSPKSTRDQIFVGVMLALIDLLFHVFRSYHTFFYAAGTLAALRFLWFHGKAIWEEKSLGTYFYNNFYLSGYWKRLATVASLAAIGMTTYFTVIRPLKPVVQQDWRLDLQHQTGIKTEFGNVYDRVDPRVAHIAKWLLVAEGVAIADYDNDGFQDLFFTNGLKTDSDRNSLYRNLGNFKFERVPLPALNVITPNIETYGLPSNAVFVDYDNDGDQDLFVIYAFGKSRLLQNQLEQTGRSEFVDASDKVGPFDYSIAVAATFFDANRDGKLDLLVANAMTRHLPDYETPTILNLFKLPEAKFDGDRRMFHFMHESWHQANNGDLNDLYLSNGTTFEKQDSVAWGMDEKRWHLAVGAADLNRDGYTDLYFANDFGPDELYLSEQGRKFSKVRGSMFGSIGRDTYKGMNVSIADYDKNGWLDVYVSNVHHALQAEGSLLWMFSEGTGATPEIKDAATRLGALNEDRFGWGGAASDLNNDGWPDILQVNGMVDDSRDKKYENCLDYWYINEKLARSAPGLHSYADKWGDIRGACIHDQEKNRVYLNQGNDATPQFVDVSPEVGFDKKGVYRGVATVDLNNDGRRDVIVTSLFQDPLIYRNVDLASRDSSHWIGMTLEGDGITCPRQAFGSRVTVLDQVQEVQLASGFAAQGDTRLHFGLGKQKELLTVSVEWCGQTKQIFKNVSPDQYHKFSMLRSNLQAKALRRSK
jgi:enediyne biosynthesis protein E4